MANPNLEEDFEEQIKKAENALMESWSKVAADKFGQNIGPYLAPYTGDFWSPRPAEPPALLKASDDPRAKREKFIYESIKDVSSEDRKAAREAAEKEYERMLQAPRTPSGEIAPITGQSLMGGRKELKSIDETKKFEDLSLWEALAVSSVLPPEQRKGFAGSLVGVFPQRIRTKAEQEEWQKALEENPGLLSNLEWLGNVALTYTDEGTGEIVENAPGWWLRLLSVPVSALVAAAEPVARDIGRGVQELRGIETYAPEDIIAPQSYETSFARRIAAGEGVMGPGAELGSQLSFETGGLAGTFLGPAPALLNFAAEATTGYPVFDKEALRWLGGFSGGTVGLAIDFALPIVPVPTPSAVAGTARGASKIAQTTPGLKGAAKGLEKVAEAVEPLSAQGIKRAYIDRSVDDAKKLITTDEINAASKELTASSVPFEKRDGNFYLDIAKNVAKGADEATLEAKASMIKEVDQFTTSKQKDWTITSYDQFYNYVGRKQVDGKTGLWNLFLGPNEKLEQVGNIGFLPKNKIDEFYSVAKPLIKIVSDEIDQKIIAAGENWVGATPAIIEKLKASLKNLPINNEQKVFLSNILDREDALYLFRNESFLSEIERVDNARAKGTLINLLSDAIASSFNEYQTIFDLNRRFKSLQETKPTSLFGEIRRDLALDLLSESAFQPTEINSVITRAFKALDPTKKSISVSPLSKLIKEKISGEWANINQKLRRQFAEENRKVKDRIIAFENIFLPQTKADTSVYVNDFVATLLGRVETIDEALSTGGTTTASQIFKRAEKVSKEIIEQSELLRQLSQKEKLNLNDVALILDEVIRLEKNKIPVEKSDLLNIVVYKKIYSLQADSLEETFRILSQENPNEFPFTKITSKINKIANKIINLDALPLKTAAKPRVKPSHEVINKFAANILEASLTKNNPKIPREISENYDDVSAFVTNTLNELDNSWQVKNLSRNLPEENIATIIKESLKFVNENTFLPLLGEKLATLRRTNPMYAELFSDLGTSANIRGAQEIVRKLNKIADAVPAGKKTRLHDKMLDIVDNLSGLGSFAKGALLAGRFAPNFRFLVSNHLTGPFIIYSTLGAKYGAGAIPNLLFANPRIERLLSTMSSPEFISPRAYGVLNTNLNDIAVRTPKRTYTYAELRDLVENTTIMRGQARAEVTRDVIKDFVSRTRIALKDAGPSVQNPFVRGVKRWTLDNENVFSDISNMTDTRFRLGVLVKALESGESEATAIRLARESLFDYGNLTDFEKNYINKFIWFWTFARNNYVSTTLNLVENPARLKNLYLTKKYFDFDRENSVSTKEYAEARIGRWIFENNELLERYSLNGPPVPLLEGYYELIDALSSFAMLFGIENGTVPEQLRGNVEGIARWLASKANPVWGSALLLATDFDPKSPLDDKRPTAYLDPKLATYLYNTGLWPLAETMFFEPVKKERERSGVQTFEGRQWKLRDDMKKWWVLTLQAVTMLGINRTARDYAPLFDVMFSKKIDEEKFDVTGIQLQPNIPSFIGLTTPIAEPSLEQVRENIRMKRAREIAERTRRR